MNGTRVLQSYSQRLLRGMPAPWYGDALLHGSENNRALTRAAQATV